MVGHNMNINLLPLNTPSWFFTFVRSEGASIYHTHKKHLLLLTIFKLAFSYKNNNRPKEQETINMQQNEAK